MDSAVNILLVTCKLKKMNDSDELLLILNQLEDYYDTLINEEGMESKFEFLKIEVKCLDECLNLIDLLLLPLPMAYIEKARVTARKALKEKGAKAYFEITSKERKNVLLQRTKDFSEATTIENNLFYAFWFLFPPEIEPLDLNIEYYIGNLLKCEVEAKSIITIVCKYFDDIINIKVANKQYTA